MNVPLIQKAVILSSPNSPLIFSSNHPIVSPEELQPGECLVHITHSGVCHSDLSLRVGEWPAHIKPKDNLIGGHEGVGIVVAIGKGSQQIDNYVINTGDRVGVKWIARTCGECNMCTEGLEQYCRSAKKIGYTEDGTFQEYAVAHLSQLILIPEEIESPAACSLMCAGITVYSALKSTALQPGDTIVVHGSGGGLGHLAVQYAVAMGLRVIAIDTSAEKRDAALSHGATHFIDFLSPETGDVVSSVQKAAASIGPSGKMGPHGAIVTATSLAAYNQAMFYVRPTGVIAALGLPPSNDMITNLLLFVGKGLTLRGSYVGSRQETIEAVRMAAGGKVKVQYEIRGLSELESVYTAMKEAKLVGRVVLDISK